MMIQLLLLLYYEEYFPSDLYIMHYPNASIILTRNVTHFSIIMITEIFLFIVFLL